MKPQYTKLWVLLTLEIKMIISTGTYLIIHLLFNNKNILMDHIVNRTHPEVRYIGRSVFMNEANKQNQWNFELGSHQNMNVPI